MPKSERSEVMWDSLALIATFALILTLHRWPAILAATLLLVWAVIFLSRHERHDLAFFLVGIAAGLVGEIAIVASGAWTYPPPTILGIPVWIPIAWGVVVLSIKRIATGILK
jgi:uncharacterized membrane protein YoaT (DUF817 family)